MLLEMSVTLMKTALILTLTITFLAVSGASACDKTKAKNAKKTNTTAVDNAKKTQAASTEQKGGVLLTGSYIKQNLNRNGRITDGANQVIVLDRETIERSGASDLKQLLIHTGV